MAVTLFRDPPGGAARCSVCLRGLSCCLTLPHPRLLWPEGGFLRPSDKEAQYYSVLRSESRLHRLSVKRLFLFFLMWTIFKVFIELFTILLLFYYGLVFLALRHVGS